ncbi:MAG TPA: hypothetical protein VGJ30_09955 [Candidatus Angelobacter sp.]|jgi:hypothetical protein
MKKKTGISGAMIAGIILVAAIVAFFIANPPQPLDPRDSNSITCSGTADLFLYNLKTGWSNDAKKYWKTGVDPKLLFSVSDYRHLSDGYFKTGTLLFYDYEVNSSTEGGIPIRKHWSIIVDPDADSAKGEKCAIVDLREAE